MVASLNRLETHETHTHNCNHYTDYLSFSQSHNSNPGIILTDRPWPVNLTPHTHRTIHSTADILKQKRTHTSMTQDRFQSTISAIEPSKIECFIHGRSLSATFVSCNLRAVWQNRIGDTVKTSFCKRSLYSQHERRSVFSNHSCT